jgi:hypothetical protein
MESDDEGILAKILIPEGATGIEVCQFIFLFLAVLEILDILVRIRIRGLMDTDTDPTPDLTPFFSNFKDAKKNVFIFFSYNYPQAQYLLS